MSFEIEDIESCIPHLMGCAPPSARKAMKNFSEKNFYFGTTYRVPDRRSFSSKVRRKYQISDEASWIKDNYVDVTGTYHDARRIGGCFEYMIVPETERGQKRKKKLGKVKIKGGRSVDYGLGGKKFTELPSNYAGQNERRAVVFNDEDRDYNILVWFMNRKNVPETNQWWDMETNTIRGRYPELEGIVGEFYPKYVRGYDVLINTLGRNTFEVQDKRTLQSHRRLRIPNYSVVGGLTSPEDGHVVFCKTKSEYTDVSLYFPSTQRKPKGFGDKPVCVLLSGRGRPNPITHIFNLDGTADSIDGLSNIELKPIGTIQHL